MLLRREEAPGGGPKPQGLTDHKLQPPGWCPGFLTRPVCSVNERREEKRLDKSAVHRHFHREHGND